MTDHEKDFSKKARKHFQKVIFWLFYLGNKYKLLGFIEDIISEKCGSVNSFCDIFAGTGVVGERFNNPEIKIISNDFLSANYFCLQAFLGVDENIQKNISEKIGYLNNL